MNYKNYLLKLKSNISEVNKAVKDGVVLTRLENFDYLFKKELLSLKGLIHKRSMLNRIINNATKSDFRLALFYAKEFDDIVNVTEKGYSVKGIEKQFKSIIKYAYQKDICSSKFILKVSDINGKIKIDLRNSSDKYEFEICNIVDYVAVSIYIVSLLGSFDERDKNFKDWFMLYLTNEYSKVEDELIPEPFIEKVKIEKDLKTYMRYKDIKRTDNVIDLNGTGI